MFLGKLRKSVFGSFPFLEYVFGKNDLGKWEKSQQIQEVLCEK